MVMPTGTGNKPPASLELRAFNGKQRVVAQVPQVRHRSSAQIKTKQARILCRLTENNVERHIHRTLKDNSKITLPFRTVQCEGDVNQVMKGVGLTSVLSFSTCFDMGYAG
ncbi:hypothetical protein H920_00121 [Fukomys damarensis]|uniref:Uncharacterized protein n=1 Tax=Fukomys damarensis TaxID=885580 RepID=A0A091E529_FUKDA|nr:hypothetical protein H920_00121 [Fukomys damarensis]